MLLREWNVKGKIAFGNSLNFQPKIKIYNRKGGLLSELLNALFQEVSRTPAHLNNPLPKAAAFNWLSSKALKKSMDQFINGSQTSPHI
jgi:hypothetical protein